MINKEIKVPNIGEFKNIEIIEVLISNGASIKKNDPLITIESDKSSIEIPSTFDGKVKLLKVKVGDKVSEGSVILILEVQEKLDKKKNDVEDVVKINKKIIETNTEKKIVTSNILNITPASPKIRKFARELGVNINQIKGSEREGRVVENDVKQFIYSHMTENTQNKNKKIHNEFNHSDFGEVEIKDIPRVKKIAAPFLLHSWNTIPHVTNHDEADVTEMENFRNSLTNMYSGAKKKITPLAFIAKALVASLKKFPNFNCSIDEIDNGKITLKKYYHIGIAVDTEHGLMVPKIRNVNNKNINHISNELKEISEKCKNLKIDKKEFFGGSMTITSLGGIGGSFFTPIINYPEVAILGVGRTIKKQVFLNEKYQTRIMLPLSLSYDHRIIDGAEAARFNNDIKENLGRNFAYKLAI